MIKKVNQLSGDITKKQEKPFQSEQIKRLMFYNNNKYMSEIKQIKSLSQTLNIRKITQQTIKPIIQEIQQKLATIEFKNQNLSNHTQHIKQVISKVANQEKMIKQQNNQLRSMNQSLNALRAQNQILKNRLQINHRSIQEEISSFQKVRQSEQKIVQQYKIKSELNFKQIAKIQKLNREKEAATEKKTQQMLLDNEIFKKQHSKESQELKTQFNILKNRIIKQMTQNEQNLHIINLYSTERENNIIKMQQLYKLVESNLKTQDFNYFKHCFESQMHSIVDNVKKIIDQNLSQQLRDLLAKLPQMHDQFKHFFKIESRVDDLSNKLGQFQSQIEAYKKYKIEQQNQMKQQIQNEILKVDVKTNQTNQKVKYLMTVEDTLIKKLGDFGIQLKNQIMIQNQLKSKQLFENIKTKFADVKQKLRQKQLNKIKEQRQRLEGRADFIQDLGNKIGEALKGFSSKFTLLKSDNDIFMQMIRKETTTLKENIKEVANHECQIGKIFSYLIESIMIIHSINLEEFGNQSESYAFVTDNDGVICQQLGFQQQSDKDQTNKNQNKQSVNILYRRSTLNIDILKKSLMKALITLNNELFSKQELEFLCFQKQNKPSNFFQLYILPNYKIRQQKVHNSDKKNDVENQDNSDYISPIIKNEENDKYQEIDTKNVELTSFKNDMLKLNNDQLKYQKKSLKSNAMTIQLAETNRSLQNKKFNFRSRQTSRRYGGQSLEIFVPRSVRKSRLSNLSQI